MPAATAQPEKDFFISYNRADAAWAEWIAWKLEQAGYSTVIEAWDFRPGDNFVLGMDEAATSCARTLAILSSSYLAALFTRPEWAAAFAKDPTGRGGKLIPVRVAPCEVPGLLGPIVYGDLVGKDEEAAERALLAAVSRERAKPDQPPPFPGTPRPQHGPVPYPGNPAPQAGGTAGAAVGPVPAEREPLPGPPAHFFGRDTVLKDIIKTLLEDKVCAIPILGPGGIGKSTVSRAALHAPRVVQRFGERRYFVRCETSQTAEVLVAMTARALGVPPGPLLQERLLAELGRERTLLVLDNLETPWWADEEGTETFLEKLGALPLLALMASIRGQKRPLHPDWREPIGLKPLTETDAKQVFLATAGRSFARDPLLNPLLEEIERVPLAIELLAHASQTEPDLQGMWKSWQQKRTALLRRGEGTSRLSSVEFSYELSIGSRKMTPLALRLLGLLALLPGGLEREDLNELPEELDPFSAARTLREVGLAHDEGQRLRMLAPLREYVSRHHPPQASDLDAIIDHYVDMATRLGRRVGWEGGGDASRRLADEVANLDSMIERALNREDPLRALEAAKALAEFIRKSGLGSPRILAVAREAAHRVGEVLGEAHCIRCLGDIALARSEHEEARKRYDESLPLYRRVGSVLGEAHCIYSLGDIALARSEHEEARKRYNEVLPLFRRGGSVLGEANCIQRLGDIALARSEHEEARKRYDEALPLFRRVRDVLGEATCIWSLGTIALERSEHEEARKRYDEALPLYRRVGSVLGEANCIRRLGDIALTRSEHEEARKRYDEALPLYRRVGDVLGEANCIKKLGDIALARSEHEEARKRYDEALPLFRRVGSVLGEANCIKSLGDIALARSEHEEARKRYDGALKLYTRVAEPYSMGMTHRKLARMANSPAERLQHILAARAAWARIKRDDLLQALTDEFGEVT